MNLYINDLPCEAAAGQTLGKAARLNHSHVGYVCGGHGICQACYVTVQEGGERLSPLSDIEKAFLSPRQIAAGGRLACQATIAGDGTIRVFSRPEQAKRLLLSNPLGLFSYGAEMGRDVLSQIVPGFSNLAGRIQRGELGGPGALGDVLESAGAALQLILAEAPKMIPFREQLTDLLGALPVRVPFLALQQSAVKPELISLNVSINAAAQETDVASLEGVVEAHALKLIKAGVKSFDMLLERGKDRAGRKSLSASSGLDEAVVLTLVNRADLARIKGIGSAYSELLEAAGVDTVPELAQRKPAHLHAKILEVNTAKKLVQQLPSEAQVREWVEQARVLGRVVTY
jgi:chlorosome envelope protein I